VWDVQAVGGASMSPYLIACKSIKEARYKAVKLIQEEGDLIEDERGELIKEIWNLSIHLTGNNRQPSEPGLITVLGVDFAEGLINNQVAKSRGTGFEYAYGWELRENDALEKTYQKLKADPATRRAYIPMFKPRHVGTGAGEVPCFVGIHFLIRDEALLMTAFSRSNENVIAMQNDIYGFTQLQAWMARRLGYAVGDYYQDVVSAHIRVNSEADEIKRILKVGI
jgi:thymidylate synthase